MIPLFCEMKLNILTRAHVRTWVANMDCSNKRIINILSPLRAALQDAQHDDLIPVNPLFGWTYKRNEPPKEKTYVDPLMEKRKLQ